MANNIPEARDGLLLTPGVITVEENGSWLLVAIGRSTRTKRFNLTRSEAAQLMRILREKILTEDEVA